MLNALIYLVATALGLALSGIGFVFALLSGPTFAFMILGALALAHHASFVYVWWRVRQGAGPWAAVVLVLPLPAVMGVAFALLLVHAAWLWLVELF